MLGRATITGIGWLTLAYLLLPLVVVLGSSLTASQFLAFPPKGWTLDWYRQVLLDQSYIDAFKTSTLLAATATLIAVILGLAASLGLSRDADSGRSLLSALFMSPLVLPHIVLAAAFLQFCAQVGLIRTYWAFLLGHALITTPFVIQAVVPLLTHEQRTLEEASLDLGAGPFETFCYITFPLVRSGIISGGLFAFISSWINVEMSMFNTTASMTTVPVKLLNHVQYQVDPLIAAVSGITILAAAAVIVAIDYTIGLEMLAEKK